MVREASIAALKEFLRSRKEEEGKKKGGSPYGEHPSLLSSTVEEELGQSTEVDGCGQSAEEEDGHLKGMQ